MARLYVVKVEISEAATDYAYPIVTHLFRGRTRKEARDYHEAHRRSGPTPSFVSAKIAACSIKTFAVERA